MKKLLFSVLFASTIFTTSFATETKVNRNVSSAFAREYRQAQQVEWVSKPEYVKASFVENNKKVEVFYDHNGSKIGSSSAISIEQLPTAAKRMFAKKYGTYTVREAIEFTNEDEDTTYFLNVANEKEKLILKVNGIGVQVYKRL